MNGTKLKTQMIDLQSARRFLFSFYIASGKILQLAMNGLLATILRDNELRQLWLFAKSYIYQYIRCTDNFEMFTIYQTCHCLAFFLIIIAF